MNLLTTPEKRMLGFLPETINGIRIVVSENLKETPVLQLSEKFTDCSPEFRVEFNQYLLQLFGKKQDVLFFNNHAYMNKRTYDALRMEITK